MMFDEDEHVDTGASNVCVRATRGTVQDSGDGTGLTEKFAAGEHVHSCAFVDVFVFAWCAAQRKCLGSVWGSFRSLMSF